MQNSPHILFIGDASSVHLQRWLVWFKSQGYKISVAGKTQPTDPNIPFIQLDVNTTKNKFFTLFTILKGVQKVRRYCRMASVDVINCHFTNFNGWIGAFSGFQPCIQTIWGSDVMVDKGVIEGLFNAFAWSRASTITVHSQYMADTLVRKLPRVKSKIQIVRWGVEQRFFATPAESSNLKSELDLNDKIVVFCPRSIQPIYNITTIIKSIALLVEKNRNIQLLLTSHNADPAYFSLVKDEIEKLNISQHVKILPSIPYNDIPDYYRISNIVISLSRSEGLPISVLESMATGAPVIVGDIPQIKELSQNSECLTVPLDQPGAIASAMDDLLLQSSTKKAEVAERAKKTARLWDFPTALNQMAEIFQSSAPEMPRP